MNHAHPSLALLLCDAEPGLDIVPLRLDEPPTVVAQELSQLPYVIVNSVNAHQVGQPDISEFITGDFKIIYESYPSSAPSETYSRAQEELDANPQQHVVLEDLCVYVDRLEKTATTFVHFEIQGYSSGLKMKGLSVFLWRRPHSGMKWRCHQLVHYKGLPDWAQWG